MFCDRKQYSLFLQSIYTLMQYVPIETLIFITLNWIDLCWCGRATIYKVKLFRLIAAE